MSENITPTAIQVSNLPGGDSSTGGLAESQDGTPPSAGGGVSPMVPPLKKFPILLTIVLLFLSVVAAISIYLLIQVRQMALEKTVPLPTPSPVASVDPTSNWQSYSDESKKFTLKHSNNWTESQKVPNKDRYTQVVDLAKLTNDSFYHTDKQHVIWVKYIENLSKQSLEKIIQSGDLDKNYGSISTSYLDSPPQFSITNINNNQVYFPDDNWPSANGIKTAFIKNEMRGSYAWISLEPIDSELLLEFDQILSTFKFIDSQYTCPESGYVDCMPVLDEAKKQACSEDAMAWYKANCPGFQGGAL